ncbi:unnamed protein product [Didymodactylos carnosus]|nr:unnamed protein product [Didymodactylos carnosus]CAF3928288.1 unnamed protein product [Didymodactylos carnosus]
MHWYSAIISFVYLLLAINANVVERFEGTRISVGVRNHQQQAKTVNEPPVPTENVKLVEGDIAVPSTSEMRNMVLSARKWPGGVIPIEFEPGWYTQDEQNKIINAMLKISEQTNDCIKFVWRENNPTWLRIFPGTGCWSYFGKIYDRGAQDLSLRKDWNYNCVDQGTVIHEIGHALGLAHEQTRPDRDNYIQIQWNNIEDSQRFNFDRYAASEVNLFNHGYDYGSVMHYAQDAFSKNGKPTMIPTYPGWESWVAQMGHASELSANDVDKIKKHYGCA